MRRFVVVLVAPAPAAKAVLVDLNASEGDDRTSENDDPAFGGTVHLEEQPSAWRRQRWKRFSAYPLCEVLACSLTSLSSSDDSASLETSARWEVIAPCLAR